MRPQYLFTETRLLFHALKQWTETLHEGLELTVAMRGVLELILCDGPDSFLLMSPRSSAPSFLHAVETSVRNVT